MTILSQGKNRLRELKQKLRGWQTIRSFQQPFQLKQVLTAIFSASLKLFEC